MSRGKNRGATRLVSPPPLDPKIARLRAARLARDAALPKPGHHNSHHRVLDLEDEIPFGKHKGMSIEGILDVEIGYVTWLLENTDVELSAAAEAEYRVRLDPRRPTGAWVD
jgi:hypothetical protein